MKAIQIFSWTIISLIICVLIWFAGRRCYVLIEQYRAESFPSVQGRILSGNVTWHTTPKGRTFYSPSFSYTYEVENQTYNGWRYRYDNLPSFPDHDSAWRFVDAHPSGSLITVFYNPKNPSGSVLSPKVDAYDVSMMFVLSPIILFFSYILIKDIRWSWNSQAIAGGVKIISKNMITHVRLPRYQPIFFGLIAVGVLTFVAGIVINVLGDSHAPMEIASFSILIIILTGTTLYLWQFHKIASGRQDLIIDEGSRTIELPLTYKVSVTPSASM